MTEGGNDFWVGIFTAGGIGGIVGGGWYVVKMLWNRILDANSTAAMTHAEIELVNQLRSEVQRLNEANKRLMDRIEELRDIIDRLRDDNAQLRREIIELTRDHP